MHSKAITGAFEGRGLWITLGAILALLAYLYGLVHSLPLERKWMRYSNAITGAPTKAQGEELMGFGKKLGISGVISTALLGLAMVAMLLSRVFPN
jgi:hypothetical protein